MRYLMTFSYDGNLFYGYQKQKGKRTIQEDIEKILSMLSKKKVKIFASGRTDKGVHAIRQKAHFDLDIKIKPYNLMAIINKRCEGIYVLDIKVVPDNFHARYDVYSKTYKYLINVGEYNLFSRGYIYQYNKKLDLKKMQEACNYLIGEHDFRSFCKEEKEKENCIRTIYKTSIEIDHDIITFTITGNGFLRKMVRNIMGVLIQIGSLKKPSLYMEELINSKGSIHNMKTTPGEGLYLEDVIYK